MATSAPAEDDDVVNVCVTSETAHQQRTTTWSMSSAVAMASARGVSAMQVARCSRLKMRATAGSSSSSSLRSLAASGAEGACLPL